MKRKIFLTILMLHALAMGAVAQELTFISFELKPVDMTAKINPVLDLNDEPCALIKVAIASDKVTFQGNIANEPTYQAGEWYLYVPAKTRRIKVSHEGTLPLTVEFAQLPEQNRTYELRIEIPAPVEAKPRTVLLMPMLSYTSNQISYGAMVAYFKKRGVFVRYKSNFNNFDTICELSDSGVDESGVSRWLTGGKATSRWALTAGYIQQLHKPIYGYLGAGYGSRTLGWEMTTGDYGSVSSASYKGFELDAGCIFKLGVVSLSAGVQTNQFKSYEFNVGVGAMF